MGELDLPILVLSTEKSSDERNGPGTWQHRRPFSYSSFSLSSKVCYISRAMKRRISRFCLLFILTVLLVCAVQKRTFTSAQSVSVDERISRVENGLLSPSLVKGDKPMKLVDEMKYLAVPGVSIAVINNGKIEWARGYGVLEAGTNGRVTPETRFQAASISKAVAAMGILSLVRENKLSLDEDVNKKLVSWKLPENEFTKQQKVTLRGLLSHSASITVHGFEGYSAAQPVPTLIQILNGTTPANSPPIRVDGPLYKEYRYAGGGFVIMQQLLADINQKPFPAFMQETVFSKLGMTHSTYEQPLPKQFANSAAVGYRSNGDRIKGNWNTYPEMLAAGLWTTPTDLARFLIEIQKTRAGKSNKILNKKMVDEMLTPQVGGRGLGLFLYGKNGTARFGHDGSNEGYRCSMIAYTDTGQGAVIMTNSDNGAKLAAEIMISIAREYGWRDFLPKEKIIYPVDPKTYDDLTGSYQLEPGITFNITAENGKLIIQAIGQEKVQLLPLSETDFFLREADVELKFIRDSQGKVNSIAFRDGDIKITAVRIK